MSWQFEDRGKTRTCRLMLAQHTTWVYALAAILVIFTGLPVFLTELLGVDANAGGAVEVDPLIVFGVVTVMAVLAVAFANDSAVELELDRGNNVLHFKKTGLMSENKLRIPLDKIENLYLEKVTIETYRREAGAFESMSSASIKGKPSISKSEELTLRIAGGNVVHVMSEGGNLLETAQQIADFLEIELSTGETTKKESYTVRKRLNGHDNIDLFS